MAQLLVFETVCKCDNFMALITAFLLRQDGVNKVYNFCGVPVQLLNKNVLIQMKEQHIS
jgi:hypothetical protein